MGFTTSACKAPTRKDIAGNGINSLESLCNKQLCGLKYTLL